MQYTIFDEIKMYLLRHRKIVVPILCLLLVGGVMSFFVEGYSARLKNEEFNEIQMYMLNIRRQDEHIYNPLNVEIVEKEVEGIDVSSFQGDIDWNKVKESGIDYAIIRCGFRNLTNEEIHVDNKFHYNISEANRLGIPVGVYFYSTAINEKEAFEEASFVLNLIKDYEVIYPVVYDFEMFNEKRTKGVSDGRINNNAIKFLDYIRAHGYHGMLYTNLRGIESHWYLDNFEGYRIWYAQYIDIPTYYGHYDMWQYTDSGRVDGIDVAVDLNHSYIAYEVVN